jgi:histidyl-tRNA synthetase
MAHMIQAPKGFEDILPADVWRWHAVENIARRTASAYHYSEIRTPVLEFSELFHRGVGETTDIVHKETFTFTDRGGDSVTMRPEGTAGVVRAMIEHNLLAQEGSRQKVYYIAPNFRYERPQKGRLRQHYQFGAEAFGIAQPEQDVECILLQLDFYRACGLSGIELYINSLGDAESKQRYREVLLGHLSPLASKLSEESQKRLAVNPLRILDSKDPRDKEACANLPAPEASLSEKSRAHFDRVHALLVQSAGNGALVKVNTGLVRGFDYYTDTVWEFTAPGLGAQNAIGGGGRYDNLVEQLGGRATPGVGFGSGLERLLIALEAQEAKLDNPALPLVFLVAHGDSAREAQWNLMLQLRAAGVRADMDLAGRSVKAQFKIADREKAAYCVVVGETELSAGTVTVKDLSTGAQTTLARDQVVGHLRGEK